MCFTSCMAVQRLQVDCASRGSVLFSADNHAVAPRDRFSYRDWLQHAQFDVAVYAGLNFSLPVEGDGDWCGGQQVPRLGQPSVSWVRCPSGEVLGVGTY